MLQLQPGVGKKEEPADEQLLRELNVKGEPFHSNLSQGQNAGAHDGTALLDAAFDEFCCGGRKPGRVVVKSAGNEPDQSGHAKVTMLANSVESLPWRSNEERRSEDTIELRFDSADELSFSLVNPDGEQIEKVSPSQREVTGNSLAGMLTGWTPAT